MSEALDRTYGEVRSLARDYFGLSDSESETLMTIAKQCALTSGVPMAGAGAVALAGVGSVSIPLVGAIPGSLAGALAGFVGGTTACMIARRSQAEAVRDLLANRSMNEADFRSAVRRLISQARGEAGYRCESHLRRSGPV